MTLHVAVSGWLLGPHSGANRRLLALLTHVAPQLAEHERVTVLHRAEFVPPTLPRIGWQVAPIPAGPTLRRVLAERRHLAACLRSLQANLLDHALLPLPRLDVPVCLTVHDPRAADGLTRWPAWLARRVLRRACAHAAVVVTPSRWTAERIAALTPGTRPVVVANGVELPHGTHPPFAASPPQGYLLHVGHVEARKNLAVVVRALRGVPADRRPQLWLAGRDAGDLAHLRHLAAADVELRAFDAVDDDRLAGLYAHARAVVMPSRYEGFGLPALEGLAHGRPVLASDTTALPEVLGDRGVLLPPTDANAWAAAITNTAPHAAPDAGNRARAAAFGWPAAAAALLAVWRGVRR